ncbi:tubulin polyglutamylase TTLL9-like [Oopsacas minuta]|uniref:Tubulin--tyrosine ligase-like protein 9 n=1 Tax=Oopsacas minuta TaxID=111878 RepID=A0AAV7K4A2_9METZ|nr:tubulin polyglutamylase TTLL9-like [Oopsacas minuta]
MSTPTSLAILTSSTPTMCRAARSRPPGGIIRFKCSQNSSTIMDVLRAQNWQEIKEEGEWDFYWADVLWVREQMDYIYLEEHVKICHFRNHYELTRKNLMARNLKRLRKTVEKNSKEESNKIDFIPTTFELPSEYHIFVEEFKKNPGSTWIMKPIGKSQGKGIFLFRKLKDITDWKKSSVYVAYNRDTEEKEQPETYIVQKYINNPFLINGKKFDIRIYVLVMSYNPLKVWIYRSGFARFSNSRFSLDSIQDAFVHLTNVAIQKTAPDYDPEKGCKWSLQELRRYLTARYGQALVDSTMREIDFVILKSLESVQKVMINDKHCFEVYGFDILFDDKFKPWLLEVNASPSLSASSPTDYELKFTMLEDMLSVIDMNNKLTGREIRVGGFDLLWNDGPVHRPDIKQYMHTLPAYPTNSFLGCQHNVRSIKMEQTLGCYTVLGEGSK